MGPLSIGFQNSTFQTISKIVFKNVQLPNRKELFQTTIFYDIILSYETFLRILDTKLPLSKKSCSLVNYLLPCKCNNDHNHLI